jgi:uncharacterized protein YpbB
LSAEPAKPFVEDVPQSLSAADDNWAPTAMIEGLDDIIDSLENVPELSSSLLSSIFHQHLSRQEAKALFDKYEQQLAIKHIGIAKRLKEQIVPGGVCQPA